MTTGSYLYDFKRDVIGDEYDASFPVRNWLRYKLVAKIRGLDCDRIALGDELAAVHAQGFAASPDSMHSFWTTYQRAIKLWYGEAFTLGHATNNVQRLVELHDAGEFDEVNELFARFATLAHVRGNFMLVPVYSDPVSGQKGNFNLFRARATQDYWDLSLAGIQRGEFSAFFGDHPVAPQFDIAAMPGGFADFVATHRLEVYVDEHHAVRPLWAGHLEHGARYLPQSKQQVLEFLENACHAIERRSAQFFTV